MSTLKIEESAILKHLKIAYQTVTIFGLSDEGRYVAKLLHLLWDTRRVVYIARRKY